MNEDEDKSRIEFITPLTFEELREKHREYTTNAVSTFSKAYLLYRAFDPIVGVLYALQQLSHLPKEAYRRVWLPIHIKRELDKVDEEDVVYID